MAIQETGPGIILTLLLVGVPFVIVGGMFIFFNETFTTITCSLSATVRNSLLSQSLYAEAVRGGMFKAFPLFCDEAVRDVSYSSFMDDIAVTSIINWESLGSGDYKLMVSEKDESNNGKLLSVFYVQFEDEEFYPSEFFAYLDDRSIPGTSTPISSVLEKDKIHFIYDGNIIDGATPAQDDVPISGNVFFSVYFVDRVTGGIANSHGKSVIFVPPCGISRYPKRTCDGKSEDEFLTKAGYCKCIYKENKEEGNPLPACSYQMPEDEIWICVSPGEEGPFTSPENASTLDDSGPVLDSYEGCDALGENCEVLQLSGDQYTYQTYESRPVVKGTASDLYAVTVSKGSYIENPSVDACQDKECFSFQPPSLDVGLNTFAVELSDDANNAITNTIAIEKLPSITVTVEFANKYVKDTVQATLSYGGEISDLEVKAGKDEDVFTLAEISTDVFSYTGFSKAEGHEGLWNLIVTGKDSEGNSITVLGDVEFIVDQTPPFTFLSDDEFTQTFGYTRGENPDVSIGDSYFIAYDNILEGSQEVYVIESQ